MRKALVEFHYAADPRNPTRYPAGADVPVKPEHIGDLVEQGKIEPLPGERAEMAAPLDLTEEERAALPVLDPEASTDPAEYVAAPAARGRRRK